MSSTTLFSFAASSIEILIIYSILLLLDGKNYLPKIKLLSYVLVMSLVSAFLGYYHVSYHFCFIILTSVILLKLLSKNQIKNIVTDLIISGSILIAIQLIITLIVGLFYGNILDNYYILFTFLILIVALVAFLNTRRKFVDTIQHFYIDSRNTIFIIAINLFFTITILLNIWTSFGDLFWSEKWNILGLVAANYIMNVSLAIASFRQKRIKGESEAYKLYGKYLEDVSLQLRSRQHEYMNQIHTMIGLAQTLSSEECPRAIAEYGETIILDNENRKKQFEICSNAIITAIVYGKVKQAEIQQIKFQHVIDETLEEMSIPAHDLAEVLSNLLSNAFEAVSELPYEEREVLLEISQHKIEVLNRIPSDCKEGVPSQIEQVGYSTKGHHRGYGVSNVINIVKRYNGSFNIFKQNDMFIFEILL